MDIQHFLTKDLQSSVWDFLGPDDLCAISQVCQGFYRTSGTDMLWKKFVHSNCSLKAVEVGYKKFFIQRMRESFFHMIQQKKMEYWFSEAVTRYSNQEKNPLRQFTVALPSRASNLQDYDYLFKIILIGDCGSGKSSLLFRFSDDVFTTNCFSTIGVDFRIRTVNVKNQTIKLQVWDPVGLERFRTITSSYCRGARGVLLCFDLNEPNSMNRLETWYSEIERYASESVLTILVGTKSDLPHVIQPSEIELFCKNRGIAFMETSAKNGTGVDEAFLTLTENILSQNPAGLILPANLSNLESVLNIEMFFKTLQIPVPVASDSSKKSSFVCALQ